MATLLTRGSPGWVTCGLALSQMLTPYPVIILACKGARISQRLCCCPVKCRVSSAEVKHLENYTGVATMLGYPGTVFTVPVPVDNALLDVAAGEAPSFIGCVSETTGNIAAIWCLCHASERCLPIQAASCTPRNYLYSAGCHGRANAVGSQWSHAKQSNVLHFHLACMQISFWRHPLRLEAMFSSTVLLIHCR